MIGGGSFALRVIYDPSLFLAEACGAPPFHIPPKSFEGKSAGDIARVGGSGMCKILNFLKLRKTGTFVTRFAIIAKNKVC